MWSLTSLDPQCWSRAGRNFGRHCVIFKEWRAERPQALQKSDHIRNTVATHMGDRGPILRDFTTVLRRYGAISPRQQFRSDKILLTASVRSSWRQCDTLCGSRDAPSRWHRKKQQQITARKKRTPPGRVQGEPRQPWRQWIGAAPAPGECECGQQETRHSNNKCPGYTGEPIEADILLLDTYLSRRRPGAMEKPGSSKHLLT